MAEDGRVPLEEWPAMEPAAGFADRVMARLEDQAQTPRPMPMASSRRSRTALVAVASAMAGAAAALLLLWLWPRDPSAPEAGRLTGSQLAASSRTTHRLGTRAIAVAEPGASMTWQLSRQGSGEVVQQSGSVFYRVESRPTEAFAVLTPHGVVRVLGTCFTVEVHAAHTMVWVHEGAVRLERAGQGATRLEAGERAEVSARGVERPRSPPVATASPRPASPPISAPSPASPAAPPKIGQDRATLLEWAKQCKVRVDMPPFEDERPKDEAAWVAYARSMGATPAEATEISAAFVELERQAFELARAVYVQTFGDNGEVETLTLDRMHYEISRASEYAEQFEVLQRLAAERAGLASAPPRERMSPLEQLMREVVNQGDRFEEALAGRLGAARARALRQRNQGWPGAGVDWQGCPPK